MQTNGVRTDTLPIFLLGALSHFLPAYTFHVSQYPLQPTSVLYSPSVQLNHQDDEDQEEKGPQDEAKDPRQGEDARDRPWDRSGPYKEQRQEDLEKGTCTVNLTYTNISRELRTVKNKPSA